ncbi:MAG: hypothetical protein MRK00_09900 [Nitrosomonas sp.]|nr:hypothetical protein [Nitrosomonas sp.]
MRWFVLLATHFIFTQPVLASLNKCVDNEGRSHYYTNIMPSECIDQATIEMNKRGVVIRTNVVQQKAKEDIDPAQKKADERVQKEEKRRDQVLLSTYTSEKEIDWVMERNIHPIELTIAGIEKRLEIARSRLQTLQQQAVEAEKTGNPTLATIQQDMVPVKRDAEQLENELQRNHDRINTLKEKFTSDKKRFRTLKMQQL